MSIDTLYNKSLTSPAQITREAYSSVGSSTFQLGTVKRAFYGFEAWNASTGGTQYVEGVDYTLETIDTGLTAEGGFNIYTGVKAINFTTGDVWFTYKVVGSYTDVSTLNTLQSDIVSLQASAYVEKRQTILKGSIDSNGYANFLTGTGTGTLTLDATPTPVVATWASGVANYKATIPTDLTLDISALADGTYYAYLDYNSGTPILGSVALVPTDGYVAGSTTSGQHHFRIPEMIMYLGDGSTAAEALHLFVGEFTVATNVISGAPVTYALRGEYTVDVAGVNGSQQASCTHAIGTKTFDCELLFYAATTEQFIKIGFSAMYDPATRNINLGLITNKTFLFGKSIDGSYILFTYSGTTQIGETNTSSFFRINAKRSY